MNRPKTEAGIVRAIEVGTRHVRLSGLLAMPEAEPRGLVLALHGGGMHSGYFDAPTDPELSLMKLACTLGYSTLALDRPGYGASADAFPDGATIDEQSQVILEALDEYADSEPVGEGCFIVAHSLGMQLAITMAARSESNILLGIDASGSTIRPRPPVEDLSDAAGSPRDAYWGPAGLYPPHTRDRGVCPAARMPPIDLADSLAWPSRFAEFAGRVVVPIRLSIPEFETWWDTSPAALEEMRSLFRSSPDIRIEHQMNAGHNISLGYSARAYHLRALAFAEECLIRKRSEATHVFP